METNTKSELMLKYARSAKAAANETREETIQRLTIENLKLQNKNLRRNLVYALIGAIGTGVTVWAIMK